MPGDIASATSPGHANRTLHPASDAWRLLTIRCGVTTLSPITLRRPTRTISCRFACNTVSIGKHLSPAALTHHRPSHSEVSPRSACSTLATDHRAVATVTAFPHQPRPCPCAPAAAPDDPGNGSSDPGQPAPTEPRRLQVRLPRREDLGAVAKGARQTWRSVVQVMALVWATSRKLRSPLPPRRYCRASSPAAQVWLAGRLIDEVVAGVQAGGGNAAYPRHRRPRGDPTGPAARLQLHADSR